MTALDELLRGSIDMHVHHAPDVRKRRLNALQAAQQARDAGMRAVVLKNRQYPTAPLAELVSGLVPGVRVFGSLCLDYEAGGLNHHALETSARLGAKVVWLPTFSSANSRARARQLFNMPLEGEGFSILDVKGRLVPEMDGLLALVRDCSLVLATGHISPAETFALAEAARVRGIGKLLITHPCETSVVDEPLTLADQKRLAGMGAFLEHTVEGLMPTSRRHDPEIVISAVKAVGPERCVISTDLGQEQNPPPVEGMRMFLSILLQRGFAPRDIELMCKVNPARLLDMPEEEG
ncbi:MAG: hypothetical protein HYX96_06000 [Chloroflexi bacterium]|nr:hypothetical protein [Chloroflexota bacterium]